MPVIRKKYWTTPSCVRYPVALKRSTRDLLWICRDACAQNAYMEEDHDGKPYAVVVDGCGDRFRIERIARAGERQASWAFGPTRDVQPARDGSGARTGGQSGHQERD